MYHGTAAFFYLSASVALAKVTLDIKDGNSFQNYQLDISAVVSQAFCYVEPMVMCPQSEDPETSYKTNKQTKQNHTQ